jgi:hypothetical protein
MTFEGYKEVESGAGVNYDASANGGVEERSTLALSPAERRLAEGKSPKYSKEAIKHWLRTGERINGRKNR